MRIAHISDLHIRNFKYRDEYRAAFDQLYRKIDDSALDLVINTGDTVHSKLAVSPELFDDVAKHMVEVCRMVPYWIILGNHDLNLKNSDRMDAISPVVRALQGKTRYELRMPEAQPEGEKMIRGDFPDFTFWNHDIRGHKPFKVDPSQINVGLYHGSISGCVTDMGFKMEKGEAEVARFSNMDYVLMGDIHKCQPFRNGRMWYAGSLIQQNYGEDLSKGFLIWEIHGKDRWDVEFVPINPPGRFYTVQVPASLDLEAVKVPPGSRIKVRLEGEITPSKRVELERAIAERFKPLEIITPDPTGEKKALEEIDLATLGLSREQMMREHLTEKGVPKADADEVIKLWDEIIKGVDQDAVRGTTWSPSWIGWDNMMNYGEGNGIDLAKIRGLVGIFAPNASGKSSIFDIIQQTFFDKMSKEVSKNIDLINDNKDEGLMQATFSAVGHKYSIVRKIERISYGQRKLAETKQWGKTSLDFTRDGESLNGTSRPETERAIRQVVGTFEDFALTTMVSQNPIFGLPGGGDIINCKETDRRKILFRFLDLDVYERVHQICKDELKSIVGSLKGRSLTEIEVELKALEPMGASLDTELRHERGGLTALDLGLKDVRERLAQFGASDFDKLAADASIFRTEVKTLTACLGGSNLRKATANLKVEELTQKLTKLEADPPSVPEITLPELTRKLDDLKFKREKVKIELARRTDELKRGAKSLKTLEDVPCEGKFPTCRYITEAVEFESHRDEIQNAITEVVKEGAGYDYEIVGLENFRIFHDERILWERSVSNLKLELEQMKAEEKKAEYESAGFSDGLAEARRQLEHLEGVLEAASTTSYGAMRAEEKELLRQIRLKTEATDAILKKIGALDARRAALQMELSKISIIAKKVAAHERLEELTGKTGLPYRILTRVLPVINSEIEKILVGVAKFSVFFEDDPESQSVSLYIRYGDYRSRPLSLGSGAEKFIASLAVRAALLNVSSLPKTDVLIIDEGFGKLDPEHLESLQRMFEYLREAFGTVFIVSHVDSMRDIVDHSIEITSQDGYAHVEVT